MAARRKKRAGGPTHPAGEQVAPTAATAATSRHRWRWPDNPARGRLIAAEEMDIANAPRPEKRHTELAAEAERRRTLAELECTAPHLYHLLYARHVDGRSARELAGEYGVSDKTMAHILGHLEGRVRSPAGR